MIPGSQRSPGGGNGNPLQYSCLENPMDREAWRASVHRVTKCLPRLSTHTHTSSVSSVFRMRASWLHTGPSHLEAERQASNSQNRKARDCCNLSPREGIFHQTVSRLPAAKHVFLRCWIVDICHESRSLRSGQRGQTAHTHSIKKKKN